MVQCNHMKNQIQVLVVEGMIDCFEKKKMRNMNDLINLFDWFFHGYAYHV